MDFKEAAYKIIIENFEDGIFISDYQSEALENHTHFLDVIFDSDKEKIAQVLFEEIQEYNGERWNYWTVTPPTAKPTRVIKNELKTVNAFLELLEKHSIDNINKEPTKRSKSGGIIIDMRPNLEYRTAQNIAQKMKHDLELLQKKCNQSDLLILQKPRYYKNTKSKEDIENTIRDIMKTYSIAIDYESIQKVRDFISRL